MTEPRPPKPSRTGGLRFRLASAFAVLVAAMLLSGSATYLGVHHLAGALRQGNQTAVARSQAVSDLGRLGFEYEHTAATMIRDNSPARAATYRAAAARMRLALDHLKVLFRGDVPGTAAVATASSAWSQYDGSVARVVGGPGWGGHFVAQPGLSEYADNAQRLTSELLPAAYRISLERAAGSASLEHDLLVGLGCLFLLSLAVAALLARKVARQVLAPVQRLRDGAVRVAAGDLDHRVTIDSGDELGEMASSFNVMAAALAEQHRSLRFQASHDELTGLANRAQLNDRLAAAVADGDGVESSVLFVDLDDFKYVNDTSGHSAGDALLQLVADRLRTCCRETDFVARLGGDEFAIVMTHPTGTANPDAMAERILAALGDPFVVEGRTHRVAASIGVATGVASELDGGGAELVRRADIAMYMAKGRGKGCYEVFRPELHETIMEHLELKADLHGVVDRDELTLDYQPVHDLDSGAIVGVEALVRWQHPQRGLLAPMTFIPLAEENGDIHPIGRWVLERAARQVRAWQWAYAGHRDLWLSVNVSSRQLSDPTLVPFVARVLAETGLAPRSLILELTESVLIQDVDGVGIDVLRQLRDLGVRVAIDDFGTGYSSLSYLQGLPVDILKVDRSFVSADPYSAGSPLLDVIVAMGNSLSLDLIAEGIEQPWDQERVVTAGCRLGQGYLFSKPVSAPLLAAMLPAQRSAPQIESRSAV